MSIGWIGVFAPRRRHSMIPQSDTEAGTTRPRGGHEGWEEAALIRRIIPIAPRRVSELLPKVSEDLRNAL